MITNWKKRAREGLGDVFAGKVEKRQRGSEAETKELYAKIGELTVEKDFCPKRSIAECKRPEGPRSSPKHPRLSIRRQCRLMSLNRFDFVL